jgi:hypothetical protein
VPAIELLLSFAEVLCNLTLLDAETPTLVGAAEDDAAVDAHVNDGSSSSR